MPVLVVERAYVDDRFSWISLGWNGLNGRAKRPLVEDDGERWRRLFGHLVQPWRAGGEYVLIMGQMRGDESIAGVDIEKWYRTAAYSLQRHGLPVLFRSHPGEVKRGRPVPILGIPILHGDLATALDEAAIVATYNSNSGVDAVLAGVPTIACDEGSMAYEVAAHGFEEPIVRPDRSAWCSRLAWCQWSEAELRDGTAWEYLQRTL